VITVEASDVRTSLPSLLERVEHGEEVIITRHGEAIARLVPVAAAGRADVSAAIAELKRLRARTTLGGYSWQELRGEGRR
jgi:prevent-host-death family protein